MLEKPNIPPHFYRRNERGLIEAVCQHTGRILAVQASERTLLEEKWERLTKIETPQGAVWIENTLNMDVILRLQAYPYSQLMADLLCEKIATGATLVRACEEAKIPYAVVLRWKREVQAFREAIDSAKQDRAHYMHDEVIQTARTEATAKDKISALQWSAEKDNPAAYSPKAKEGSGGGSVTYIINTGVTRVEKEAQKIEGESKTVVAAPEARGEVAEIVDLPKWGEKLRK
jgi:hypothetical protein